jgi:hypothetical protein
MDYKKTREVIEQLESNPNQIVNLIRHRKIARPRKDASGDFCWTHRDVEAARVAIQALKDQKARRALAKAEEAGRAS